MLSQKNGSNVTNVSAHALKESSVNKCTLHV